MNKLKSTNVCIRYFDCKGKKEDALSDELNIGGRQQ